MRRLMALLALAPMAGFAWGAVNVNTAQQSELQQTKGLDKYMAKAIIEYRAQNGAFTSIDELQKLPGFNREVIAKVGPQLDVVGPPYTPPPKPAAKEKPKK